jgi:hypothetical protein
MHLGNLTAISKGSKRKIKKNIYFANCELVHLKTKCGPTQKLYFGNQFSCVGDGRVEKIKEFEDTETFCQHVG